MNNEIDMPEEVVEKEASSPEIQLTEEEKELVRSIYERAHSLVEEFGEIPHVKEGYLNQVTLHAKDNTDLRGFTRAFVSLEPHSNDVFIRYNEHYMKQYVFHHEVRLAEDKVKHYTHEVEDRGGSGVFNQQPPVGVFPEKWYQPKLNLSKIQRFLTEGEVVKQTGQTSEKVETKPRGLLGRILARKR